MRIIQLLQKPQLRGAEIFACQLSNHLLEQGHEVLVVTIFKGDAKLPFAGRIVDLNRPLSKRFHDIAAWKRFYELIQEFKPDVIQANAADTLKFSISSRLLFSWKIPVVFRNANKISDFIDTRLKWHINNFYLSRADYVISVSNQCEKDFIKTFGYSRNKIKTVEIGVEEKTIGDIPLDLQQVFEKGPVLTHIGGFVDEKNHEGLIRIFSQLLKKSPNLQLLLIGKGRLMKKIKAEVHHLNIQNNVYFLEYRTDVLEILKFSTAFLLPSLIEGLPAVILEAMYCKTPVIAYNVGGIGEVVISDKTGWLVKKGDEEDFVAQVEKVLLNKNEVELRIQAARLNISRSYMNSNIAQRFALCYKAL